MTLTATNIDRRDEAGLVALLRRSLGAYMAGRRAAMRTTEELNSLRSRDLADLGISRHDIPALANDVRRKAVAKFLAA